MNYLGKFLAFIFLSPKKKVIRVLDDFCRFCFIEIKVLFC